jgi:hypothetical protein
LGSPCFFQKEHWEQDGYNDYENYRLGFLYRNGGASMRQIKNLTAIIEREGNGYVALCPFRCINKNQAWRNRA